MSKGKFPLMPLQYYREITPLMAYVHIDAMKERVRQNRLYGYQRHDYGDWLKILLEEMGEVAQAMQKEKGWGKETDADNLYEELIHTAAVALAIAEQVREGIDHEEAAQRATDPNTKKD